MLTSVYYYDLYKPYIMATRGADYSVAPRRSRIADKKASPPASLGHEFILNKTVKNEVVDFARNVSGGVNNLRSSARKAQQDMENFNHLVYLDGWDYAVSSLKRDFGKFTQQYNNSTDFLQTQTHSGALRTFSGEITDHLQYNRERLRALGFTFSENGRLEYDRSALDGMTHNRVDVVIGENMPVFSDLQRYADRALTEPLMDHMNFKGLGYHYNYKLGAMKADGYNLLEVGLLVDELV